MGLKDRLVRGELYWADINPHRWNWTPTVSEGTITRGPLSSETLDAKARGRAVFRGYRLMAANDLGVTSQEYRVDLHTDWTSQQKKICRADTYTVFYG